MGRSGRARCGSCGKRLDLGPGGTAVLLVGLSVGAFSWRFYQGAAPLLALVAGLTVGGCIWWFIATYRWNPGSMAFAAPEHWRQATVSVFVFTLAIVAGIPAFPPEFGVQMVVVVPLRLALIAGMAGLVVRLGLGRWVNAPFTMRCSECRAPSSIRATYCWSCGRSLQAG